MEILCVCVGGGGEGRVESILGSMNSKCKGPEAGPKVEHQKEDPASWLGDGMEQRMRTGRSQAI